MTYSFWKRRSAGDTSGAAVEGISKTDDGDDDAFLLLLLRRGGISAHNRKNDKLCGSFLLIIIIKTCTAKIITLYTCLLFLVFFVREGRERKMQTVYRSRLKRIHSEEASAITLPPPTIKQRRGDASVVVAPPEERKSAAAAAEAYTPTTVGFIKNTLRTGLIIATFLAHATELTAVFKGKEDELNKMAVGLSFDAGIALAGKKHRVEVRGDLLLKEMLNLFSYFKVNKFEPQMQVIRAAMSGLVPQIFGDTFAANRERIQRVYGYTDFRKEVLATMPRRFGKTYVAAMVEAVAMYVLQGQTALFAAFFFQASEFKNTVYQLFCQLPGGKQRIVGNNQKELLISRTHSRDDPLCGRIRAFAGKVDAARGFKAHRIYFDEASFADGNFIVSNVFAGMMLKNTFAFLISSPPTDSNSVFNQMCNSKNARGEFIFKWIRIEGACENCRREKKASACDHIVMPTPPWHGSKEDRKTIDLVMKEIDPARHQTEILGITSDNDVAAFPHAYIAQYQKLNEVHFRRAPEFIAISIDPSGAGASDTGMTAMSRDENGRTVVRFCYLFIESGNTLAWPIQSVERSGMGNRARC